MREFSIFAEQEFSEWSRGRFQVIRNEILSKDKDYILNVNSEEYSEYLKSLYVLTPLEFYLDKVTIESLGKRFDREYEQQYYLFQLKLPFSGTNELLRLTPSTRQLTSYIITVEKSNIVANFRVFRQEKNDFENAKGSVIRSINANLDYINKEVENHNNQLQTFPLSVINQRKEEFAKENEFFESINIPVNKESTEIFFPATVKKKIIPPPVVNEKTKTWNKFPSINEEFYKDLIHILDTVGKTMEKKPSLYEGKGEESLRDYFLSFLETRYDNSTGTGESFNKSGKTDILLKYHKDGTNLFIAECKIWKGEKSLLKAIDQLLGYLTWRDSKTALLIFIQERNIIDIINKIKESVKTHPQFIKHLEDSSNSSFLYKFGLKDDTKNEIFINLLCFHFPPLK